MLLVLLNTFSTQYNENDFSPIYRADSAGSRILSFLYSNRIARRWDASFRVVNIEVNMN